MNPEQAGHIRMFMFGVAQTISGIFCITAGGPVAYGLGWGIITTGMGTMVASLNSAYADYERARLDLQVWETNVKSVCSEGK